MLRYYLLRLSPGYARPPVIENWFDKINKRHITPEESFRLPYRTILPIRPNEQTVFTDIVMLPFFLVSAKLKSVMELYEPGLVYKEVILMDRKNRLVSLYFLPIMEKTVCLSDRSEFSMDKSMIKKAVIDTNRTGNKSILLLGGVSSTNVLVRLDFAESALRRGLEGISLIPVEME